MIVSRMTTRNKKRAVEMFRMYLGGKTYKQIGEAYNVSAVKVFKIAKEYGWQLMVAKYYQNIYNETITVGAKRTGAKIFSLIELYVKKIETKVSADPLYEIPLDVLKELRQLMDLLLTENRLTDNKPTANASGTIRHEIVLPPGVKHFGLDPPNPAVKQIEHEEKSLGKQIQLEDLEDT